MLWGKRSREEAEFLPAALEVLEKPASPLGRAVSIAIMLFVTVAIGWMYFSKMDVVVTAQGRVVPSGRIKVIQPVEAGVIRAIRVRDGQQVRAGEVLIELDSTTTTADREQLARELMGAQVESARLRAQLAEDPDMFVLPDRVDETLASTQRKLLESRLTEQRERLAALDSEIARRRAEREAIRSTVSKLRSTLPLMKRRLAKKKVLAKKKFISELDIIEARLEVINQAKELQIQRYRLEEAEASVLAAERQRQQAEAESRSQTLSDLADVNMRKQTAAQELIKVERRQSMQRLRAPVDGMVQQLAVNTVGGVVTAAQTLMVLVPYDMPLEVEAQVLNKDIGVVEAGQRVTVKFETYQYTRYGFIVGTMQWVGNDTVTDPQLGPVYPVRISLAGTRLPNVVDGRRGTIAPGMSVTADIEIGKRRVLEYFLTPILRYKEESLRER